MALKFGMTVDLLYNAIICMNMLMLFSMTLTMMQSHSGLEEEKVSVELFIRTTKQANGTLG